MEHILYKMVHTIQVLYFICLHELDAVSLDENGKSDAYRNILYGTSKATKEQLCF